MHGARRVDVKKRFADGLASWRAKRGASDPTPSIEQLLGLETGEHLEESTSITTAANTTKEKLTETYEGVPVVGQSVVVETDNGEPTGEISGHLIEGIDEDISNVNPFVDEEEALYIAAESWGDEPADILEGTFEVSLEIYVEDEENSPDVISILAYQLSYMTIEDGSTSRPTFIIDANTAEIIHSWEGLTPTGRARRLEGEGPYELNAVGGNPKMGKLNYGEDLPALNIWMEDGACYLHNEKVTVVDASESGSLDYSVGFSFPCEQHFNDSVNGAYSPLADGFFFGSMAYDVFYEWLGVPPLTFKVVMVVHYGDMMENAFWDGRVTSFGDGRSMFYPLVVLDVVAHEMAHGFTEQNSGLIYSGQSGGMNEAFSDIAGGAAEAYMKESDWMIGDDAFKAENGSLRYFIDPSLDGKSIGHMDNYCQPVNVHFNSGLYNRAFYLLTTTPGWNVRMSFMVFGTANQLYWTPDSSFNDGACGVMQAARDLGFNDLDVLAAFDGVGIHPCGPRFEGMHAINYISGVHNETLIYYFDLKENNTDLLRFETLSYMYIRGDYRMIIDTPSGNSFHTSSYLENLNILYPEIGRYTVTFESSDYFDGVALRAASTSHVLEENFVWDNESLAEGSFQLPQDVVDAGQTVAIRVEFDAHESQQDPPFFMLSHEAEVNLREYEGEMTSITYFNGKKLVSDALICIPQAGVYNYHMTTGSGEPPEGLVMKLEILLMPLLEWYLSCLRWISSKWPFGNLPEQPWHLIFNYRVLTHWALGDLDVNFKTAILNLVLLIWGECPKMNAKGPHW